MYFFRRVKAIMLSPTTEWPAIEQEPHDVAYLMTHYVAVLALIPAIASFLGGAVIGVSVPSAGTVRMSVFGGMMSALLSYVLSFLTVYVVAWIVDALAPSFGGTKSLPNALKLSAYASTPSWLAGMFLILPGLTFMTLLGLYGFYLLWLGLPVMMKSPAEKTTLYTLAVVACTVLLAFGLGLLQTAMAAFLGVA